MHRLLQSEWTEGEARPRMGLATILSYALIGLGLIAIAHAVDWRFVGRLNFLELWPYREALARGLAVTLGVSAVAVVLGLLIGTLLSVLQLAPIGPLRWLIVGYVEVARNTPLIVSLFWVHFALPQLTGVNTSAIESGVIAIVFQASGYLADIARAGIQAVPRGQFEAAYALALPTRTKWLVVILPQALKIVIPPLANVAISFFKASSILSALSVGELMSMGLRVSEANFRPIETITFCGLVYIVLGTIFSLATQRLELVFGGGSEGRRESAPP